MRALSPDNDVPTLGDLRRHACWLWLNCGKCGRRRPVPLAPFIIRWGPGASSNLLRRAAVCEGCGQRGATTQLPSHHDNIVGTAPFPVGR